MRRRLPQRTLPALLARVALVLGTIAVLAMAGIALTSVTERLSSGGWIPADSEAVRVDHQLASQFNRRATSHIILLTPRNGSFQDLATRREVARIASELRGLEGVTAVYTPLNAPTAALRQGLVSDDGASWLAVVQVEADLPTTISHLPQIERATASDLLDARITGVPALTGELGLQVKDDLLRAELIALPIALLLLVWFAGGYRPAMAIVLTTVTSLAITLLLIAAASHIVTVSIFTLSTAGMLTIALSLDFGLLFALRHAHRDGDRHTRATVLIAALAVVAGMAGLALLPVDAARSIGMVGVLSVAVVALGQRWLLPAWMSALRCRPASPPRPGHTPSSRWLRLVGARPVMSLIIGVAILLPVIVPVLSIRASGPDPSVLPADTEALVTLDAVTAEFPTVTATPITVIVTPVDGSMLDASNLFSLKQTADRIASLPGVRSVTTVWDLVPGGVSSPMLTASLALDPTLVEQARPLLTATGAVIEIAPSADAGARTNLVAALRSQAGPLSGGDLRFAVGGADAASADLVASVEDISLPAIITVVLATIVVLMLAFRSIVLPLKAVVLNAIPVLAGLGAVTWLFQIGTPWTDGAGTTVIVVPVILTWLMYGVSMDYEVFMLARIRELRERGYDNHDATIGGITGARAVVSRGAVLMGVVFLAFSTSDVMAIRAIGVGLLVAIVVDATVVRLVLLPASMVLLGRWNWWWPFGSDEVLEPALVPHRLPAGDNG